MLPAAIASIAFRAAARLGREVEPGLSLDEPTNLVFFEAGPLLFFSRFNVCFRLRLGVATPWIGEMGLIFDGA